ncbi:hypothetical protein AB0M48_12375 [Lentzea sp. NPDC051208]|uniref:hypothetical protein n=1 Tax=Lentzea sp. NPDC051208 TaxID=3154642 RepID=UPI0034466A82
MRALLVLDPINEITHPDDRYPEVCLDQVRERGVLENAARAAAATRAQGVPAVHVVVGFSAGYAD